MSKPTRVPRQATSTGPEGGEQAELGREVYGVAIQLRALVGEMGALDWRIQGHSPEQLIEVSRCLRDTSTGIANLPANKTAPGNATGLKVDSAVKTFRQTGCPS